MEVRYPASLVSSEILSQGCIALSARASEAIVALSKAIVPAVVIGQPVSPAPVSI